MKNIKPKKDYVLIRVEQKGFDDGLSKTKSGIIVPGKEATKTTAGFSHDTHRFSVVAVGPDVKDIEVGDLVLFSDVRANTIMDDEDNLEILIQEQFVYATYED